MRPDRLGDVLLSTPVIGALRKRLPGARVSFLVQPFVAAALRGAEGLDEILLYEPHGRHAGVMGLTRLVNDIRAGRYDVSVSLQSQRRVALALALAGVPERIGPKSKPHSWLLYTRSRRQNRSSVAMHEADYNLDLIREIGIESAPREFETRAGLDPERREAARAWLLKEGWKEGERLVVIHPGMGGSALNWPQTRYAELAQRLAGTGVRVVVSGGPAEQRLLEQMRGKLSGLSISFFGGSGGLGLDSLAGLYSWADVVVAPSTGPLHLAVALGRRVVSFYPMIRVQSPKRWGPYLKDTSRATVLVPGVHAQGEVDCRGEECEYRPCMEQISVEQAFESVLSQLEETKA